MSNKSRFGTQNEAEEEMRISLECYAKAFKASPDCIVISGFDDEGILDVSGGFEGLFGHTREEILGKPLVTLGMIQEPAAHRTFLDLLLSTGTVRDFAYTIQCKDGEITHVLCSGEVIEMNGKKYALTVHQDVTEQRKAQAALRESEEKYRAILEASQLEQAIQQAQKMEAVGRLAGGVAHDFNNILGIITGYSDLMLADPDLPEKPQRRLREIRNAANRAVSVTQQLLALSRKQMLQTKVLCLNTVIQETANMLVRLLGDEIELVTKLDPDLGSVSVDPNGIEQVVLNLAANAREAMPTGGKMTIETANVTIDTNSTTGHEKLPAGEYVMMAVSDTGLGMDAEAQKHIFEPFFTIKGGRGSGLGLSTVFGIVQQSGGTIWTCSEVGHGTTFKIYLKRFSESCPVVVP